MDTREAILVRIGDIFRTVPGIDKVVRNDVQKSDVHDVISYLDADEEAAETDMGRGRPSEAPRKVAMEPEIYISLGRRTDDVGTVMNAYRAKLLGLIFADAALKSILGTNGTIEYLGCKTDLARGRTMIGEVGIGLRFHYIMRPASDF